MKKNIGIVYLAAGVSRRFNYKPKFLQEVGKNGETLMECSLNQSLKAGFNRIHIIVSNKTEPILKDKFGESYHNIPILYSKQSYDPTQRDKPWGQVDALCSLNEEINYPLIVCNADDLYGENSFRILYNHLVSNLDSGNQDAASVMYVLGDVLPEKGTVNRGIFKEDGQYANGIIETSSISRENLASNRLSLGHKASMGIFALHPETIKDLKELLTEFKKHNSGDKHAECVLGTELSKLIEQKKLKIKLYPSRSKWIGVTNPGDVEIVRQHLNKSN